MKTETIKHLMRKPIKYRKVKVETIRGKIVDGFILSFGALDVVVARADGRKNIKIGYGEWLERLSLAV